MPGGTLTRLRVRSTCFAVRTFLGQSPFLHPLRGQQHAAFVRGLHWYYEPVRLPAFVHCRRAPFGFTARACTQAQVKRGISRLPVREAWPPEERASLAGCVRACMRSVIPRCPPEVSRWRPGAVWPSAPLNTRRHADSGSFGIRYPARTYPCQRFDCVPYGRRRMTRGRCGSLGLHRMKLSFTTSCRLRPAHSASSVVQLFFCVAPHFQLWRFSIPFFHSVMLVPLQFGGDQG